MLSLRPLLVTEIMIPMPINIATPIKVHAVPMRSRMPNFQSAARRPPIRTTNPKRYMPAHFMTNLPIKSGSYTRRMPADAGAVCMPANQGIGSDEAKTHLTDGARLAPSCPPCGLLSEQLNLTIDRETNELGGPGEDLAKVLVASS